MAVSITPTLAQVAALCRAWTRQTGTNPQELGTFTSETRPTDVEAQAMIDTAVMAVKVKIGDPQDSWGSTLTDSATILAAYRAAELIAASYAPEDADAANFADRMHSLYEELEPAVIELSQSGGESDVRTVLSVFSSADRFYDQMGVYQVQPAPAAGSERPIMAPAGPFGYWILDAQGREVYVPRIGY